MWTASLHACSQLSPLQTSPLYLPSVEANLQRLPTVTVSPRYSVAPSSHNTQQYVTSSAAQEGTDVAVAEEPVSLDIVGTYAERLSAVTHAFALCCHTLQKASGRLVWESPITCKS